MFYGKRIQVRNALHLLQRKVCGYDGLFRENPPPFCDCKYGWDNTQKPYSETTCCPELRTVVELLDKMTEKEYNKILSRNIK